MYDFRRLSVFLAASAAICCACFAYAKSGDVAFVDSQGRQWRQVNTTCGLTWNEVAARCPTDGATPCVGTINNQSIGGWVWATHEQVLELLAELGAGTAQLGCDSGPTAAGVVFQYFQSTTNADLTSLIEAWTSTVVTLPGLKGLARSPFVQFDQDTLVGLTCANSLAQRSESSTDRGVWLFRPRCAADLDADGIVGPSDLTALLGAWGIGGPADIDLNGTVGSEDILILLASWGSGNC